MIRAVRSITLVVALILLGAGIFLVDAPTEMAQALRAYRHLDMDQAMRHARRAVKAGGSDVKVAVRALKLESTIAMKSGRPERAMAYLSQAILMEPDCSRCYLQRGDMLFAQKNYPAALLDFKKGLAGADPVKDKTRAYYYAREGLSFLAVGDDKNARADAQKARGLDPASPLAHFLESRVLNNEGDLEGAFSSAHTAYQLGQKTPGFFSTPEGDMWLRYYAGVRLRYSRSRQ